MSALIRRSPFSLAGLLFTGCGLWSAAGPGCGIIGEARAFPEGLTEASGVAPSLTNSGVFWTHSDNAGPGVLWAVDAEGAVLGEVSLEGVRVFDAEDLAAARCGEANCLYLGDVGDNYGERDSLLVYRVIEPEPGSGSVASQRLAMTLPDGARNVEALFVLPGERLFLVTKGQEQPITVYRYPGRLRPDSLVMLEEVQRLSETARVLPRQVTGASAAPDGSVVAIRTYETLLFYLWDGAQLTLLEDGTVNLRTLREAQGEGVGIGEDGLVVLTSEGEPTGGAGSITVLRCRVGQGE